MVAGSNTDGIHPNDSGNALLTKAVNRIVTPPVGALITGAGYDLKWLWPETHLRADVREKADASPPAGIGGAGAPWAAMARYTRVVRTASGHVREATPHVTMARCRGRCNATELAKADAN